MAERQQSRLFIVLVGVVALALFTPVTLQERKMAVISSGDHGRDLYLANQVAKGKTYLRDFSYIYGPLSLEVHGILFRLKGPSVKSMLWLRSWLLLMLVVVAYIAYLQYASAVPAAIAALWTAAAQFTYCHTFNHIYVTIGIAGFIGSIAPWLGVQPVAVNGWGRSNERRLYIRSALGAVAASVALLSKLNIGAALIAGFGVCLGLEKLAARFGVTPKTTGPAGRFTWVLLGGAGGLTGAMYGWYFLHAQADLIWASFPYAKISQIHYGSPLSVAWRHLQGNALLWDGVNYLILRVIFLILAAVIAYVFIMLFARKDDGRRSPVRRLATYLGVIGLLVGHEWVIEGAGHALVYYSAPVAACIVAIGLDNAGLVVQRLAESRVNRQTRISGRLVVATVGIGIVANLIIVTYNRNARPLHMLTMPRGGTGVLPPDYYIPRVGTAEDGTRVVGWRRYLWNPAQAYNAIADFVMRETKPDEPVLTLPFEPADNFFADRPYPTHHIEFFQLTGLKKGDEQAVIDAMERVPVRLVLLSNRGLYLREPGVRPIPEDFPMLYSYIRSHYETAGTLGDFESPPAWAGDHGVVVFWRKSDKPEDRDRLERYKRELNPLAKPLPDPAT